MAWADGPPVFMFAVRYMEAGAIGHTLTDGAKPVRSLARCQGPAQCDMARAARHRAVLD